MSKQINENHAVESNSKQADLCMPRDGDSALCLEPELRFPQLASDHFNSHASSSAELAIPKLELSREHERQNKIDKPGNYSQTLTFDGIERHYNLHVPPDYDPAHPMPLVLVLHGHGDDAAGIARISGMDAEADKKGFIVAYPEAVHWLGEKSLAAWNTGNGLVPPGMETDDSGFLRTVIDNCQSQFSIDKNRTFLVGFSNGGMEAYKAATELSDKLAAVVAVSGAMGGSEGKPELPVSMLSIVGTADDGVPLSGRTREDEAEAAAPEKMKMLAKMFPLLEDDTVSPVASELLKWLAVETEFVPEFKPVTWATKFWKSVDGITGPGIRTENGGVHTETYTDPKNGVTVQQEIIDGGDHMIEHSSVPDYKLADDVWNFLNAHPRVNYPQK